MVPRSVVQNLIQSPRWTQPSVAAPLDSLTVSIDDWVGVTKQLIARHVQPVSDLEGCVYLSAQPVSFTALGIPT